jgi:negative regulator of sigma E activity
MHEHLTMGLAARVNRAIDGEPKPASGPTGRVRSQRWWRPVSGAAVAAGVAAVAIVALQQRAVAPTLHAAIPVVARNVAVARNKEALSYTVPATVSDAPAALPAARLTNYVFAHSKYSSSLGQSNVLTGLLTEADDQEQAAGGAAQSESTPDTRNAP